MHPRWQSDSRIGRPVAFTASLHLFITNEPFAYRPNLSTLSAASSLPPQLSTFSMSTPVRRTRSLHHHNHHGASTRQPLCNLKVQRNTTLERRFGGGCCGLPLADVASPHEWQGHPIGRSQSSLCLCLCLCLCLYICLYLSLSSYLSLCLSLSNVAVSVSLSLPLSLSPRFSLCLPPPPSVSLSLSEQQHPRELAIN